MNLVHRLYRKPLVHSLLYWWPWRDHVMPDMLHCLSVCVAILHSTGRLTCLADPLHSIPAAITTLTGDLCREAFWDSYSLLSGLDSPFVRVFTSFLEDLSSRPLCGHELSTLTSKKPFAVQSSIRQSTVQRKTTCLCNLIKLSLIKFNFPVTLSLSW